MGMLRVASFADAGPTWTAVRDQLIAAGANVQMRMIDNLPAFPDEEPEPDWRELRVTLGVGMLTVRREPSRWSIVIWGNADEALRRDQETLARACAEAGGGTLDDS